MKRSIAIGLAAVSLMLAGVACDDANKNGRHDCNSGSYDQDDCRIGPGDGVDEPGPLR